jgi:hypothetical protein
MKANSRGWIANRKLGTCERTSGNQVVGWKTPSNPSRRPRPFPGCWYRRISNRLHLGFSPIEDDDEEDWGEDASYCSTNRRN